MAIDRTAYNALVDDDGSNLVGSLINKIAIKNVILDPVDVALALLASIASPTFTGVPSAPTAAPGVNTTQLSTTAFVTAAVAASVLPIAQTTTLTGTQDNVALTPGCGVLRCNNATLLTLTGLAAGVDGQRLTIRSVGAGQVDLAPQAAGSTAANRLVTIATVYNASLAPGVGAAELRYDATFARWVVVQHTQGAWINIPYLAGDFTASGSMTWTVDAGDVLAFAYLLNGRTVTVAFAFQATTVGGTLSNTLNIRTPFSCIHGVFNNVVLLDNLTRIPGYLSTTADKLAVVRQDVANFAASTNQTYVYGEVTFDV